MASFLTRVRQAIAPREKALSPVGSNQGGWWPIIRESFAGAWQQNVEINNDLVLSFHAVYACLTLIASDIAKLRVKLVVLADGIWTEATNPAYSPVLRKPNSYQTRIQFWECWVLSKLTRGNTYVLKVRDYRNVVVGLHVLNPTLVLPLVADNGDVYYQLSTDNLVGLTSTVTVPASEIIHDRWNCLFHPLVGVSPIFACGLAATQGLKIQNNSATFFANGSRPSGVLTAPGHIGDDTADRLKTSWEQKFGGANQGKVAVLGDGLHYEQMSMTATDAQLIEQLKWSAETVCSTFHVPPYKLGLGSMPTNNNVQSLNLEYYTQCLQVIIEAAELCLDEGLGIGEAYSIGTEFDLDGLLRMDSTTQVSVLKEAVGAGLMKPDEGRAKLGLGKVAGGDTPYLQQQNYSLAALAKRDAQDNPFSTSQPDAQPAPAADDAANDNAAAEAAAREAIAAIRKGLA